MFGKEPTVVLNAIAEVVRAIIPLLIIFGYISWTDEQVAQVMLVVGVVVTALTTILARSQTVPTETANKQIEVAIAQPSGTSVEKVVAITKAQQG
jgi:hypothetical protein